MDRSDVIRKLKSLFRLAARAGTEGEANAAMAAAQRLMVEYGLSASDAEARNEDPEPIVRVDVCAWRAEHWRQMLSRAVCRLTGTDNVYTSTKRMMFVGLRADAEIAAALFKVLVSSVNRLSLNYFGASRRDFRMGFSCTVVDRAFAMQGIELADAQRFAVIVRSKQARIAEYLREQGVKDREGRHPRDIQDHRAYMAGAEAGARADLGFKSHIASQESSAQLQLEMSKP